MPINTIFALRLQCYILSTMAIGHNGSREHNTYLVTNGSEHKHKTNQNHCNSINIVKYMYMQFLLISVFTQIYLMFLSIF